MANNLTRENSVRRREGGLKGGGGEQLIESSIEARNYAPGVYCVSHNGSLILRSSFQSSAGFKLNIVPNQSRRGGDD